LITDEAVLQEPVVRQLILVPFKQFDDGKNVRWSYRYKLILDFSNNEGCP